VNVVDPEAVVESRAVTVTVAGGETGAEVGMVPKIRPVEGLIDSPGGSPVAV
jgi:hypothetical protein